MRVKMGVTLQKWLRTTVAITISHFTWAGARPLPAQGAAKPLSARPAWVQALSNYKDAEAAEALRLLFLIEKEARGAEPLSDYDHARLLTFTGVVLNDLGETAGATAALHGAWSHSVAAWSDSATFGPSRRDFVRRLRAAAALPRDVVVQSTDGDFLISVIDEAGMVVDASRLVLSIPGRAEALSAKGAIRDVFAEGDHQMSVRVRLSDDVTSAPLLVPLRVSARRADTTAIGAPPSPPSDEPTFRVAARRGQGMKTSGWLLGGGLAVAGLFLGSRCEAQWDAGAEKFKGYAQSCGGWAGVAGTGMLFLIGANSFLNKPRPTRVEVSGAARRNSERRAAYERDLDAFTARLNDLRQQIRFVLEQAGAIERP